MTLPVSVHFVEPGGHGGVFQHTAEAARRLALSGVTAVVHTADDHEPVDADGVTLCGCTRWFRHLPRGAFRKLLIAFSYVFFTIPHLRGQTSGSVTHVQGFFASPLYAVTMLVIRWRKKHVLIYSPHNTFSRSGRWYEEKVLHFAASRLADVVVAFSKVDAERVESWGARVVRSPLVQLTPTVSDGAVKTWRDRLTGNDGRPVLLVPGQIRPDKGVDIVIQAAHVLHAEVRVAVVGEDKGDLDRCRRIASELGVDVTWVVGFLSLEDFAAAIAAADLVVLAYRQASQSGVLALASALGTPSVASPVGGLSEYASVTSRGVDPAAMAEAISEALQHHVHVKSAESDSRFMDVYQLDGRSKRRRRSFMPAMRPRSRA